MTEYERYGDELDYMTPALGDPAGEVQVPDSHYDDETGGTNYDNYC